MVWDEDKVREWSDVAREARKGNCEVNFGYLFGICVEKNSELPPLHPKRKFKGRVVFQGNRVTNQNWEAAMFQDLGSCPATMEASKAADFYGLTPGLQLRLPMQFRRIFRPNSPVSLVWSVCHLKRAPILGAAFKGPLYPC